jgi:hypothetical protein
MGCRYCQAELSDPSLSSLANGSLYNIFFGGIISKGFRPKNKDFPRGIEWQGVSIPYTRAVVGKAKDKERRPINSGDFRAIGGQYPLQS